jgi:uncharacterized protein YheU (UPF0270 family)
MQDERKSGGELEREPSGEAIAAIRVAPDDLETDTLRAVIESFVLREGTDYGLHEASLEAKVAQVLTQLRRGEAHITFDPATESVNVVVTSAIGGSGRSSR